MRTRTYMQSWFRETSIKRASKSFSKPTRFKSILDGKPGYESFLTCRMAELLELMSLIGFYLKVLLKSSSVERRFSSWRFSFSSLLKSILYSFV